MITTDNYFMAGQPGFGVTAPGTGSTYSPILRTDSAQLHTVMITVESIAGAPSAASLAVKFQGVMPTHGTYGTTAYVTDNNPLYFDITDANLLPLGDWPAELANQTLAAPVTFIRQLKGGFRWRLALIQSFTGGTTPSFKMTSRVISQY